MNLYEDKNDPDKEESELAAKKISDEKLARYEEIREESLALYNTFGTANCPAFKRDGEIAFNAEGFNHLIYRIKKQERNKRVQIMRFEMLTKTKELLERTTTVQEYEEYMKHLPVKMKKHKEFRNVRVRDWGFIGIIGNFRIKVVVRQIGNGKKEFFSVIPAWSTKYYRDIKIIRNTKGNVADD